MYEAPYAPYDFTDKNSFAYETVLKRWPIILTNIIDTIYRRNHDFSLAIAEKDPSGEDVRITQATIDEGKAIIERIGKLKYEMARDRPLEPIQDDGEPQVEIYNTELAGLTEQGKGSWFQVPWLFSECFLFVIPLWHMLSW